MGKESPTMIKEQQDGPRRVEKFEIRVVEEDGEDEGNTGSTRLWLRIEVVDAVAGLGLEP